MTRWVVTALVAILVLVGGVVWAQSQFEDVPPDHDHAEAIEYVAARGWFVGYADGTFGPDRTITPEQAVRVLERAFPNGLTRGRFAEVLYIADDGNTPATTSPPTTSKTEAEVEDDSSETTSTTIDDSTTTTVDAGLRRQEAACNRTRSGVWMGGSLGCCRRVGGIIRCSV